MALTAGALYDVANIISI